MEKDYMEVFVKNLDTRLFEIVSNLICSICKELYSKPVTTPCGHSFCNGCIRRVLSSKDNNGCPLCKTPVKRYGLEEDAVKSTFINILKELPAAFQTDIEDLTKNHTDLGKDLIKTSKLFHVCNQEPYPSKKSASKRRTKKGEDSENAELDSGSFIPVLKRTKNVLEYASAKKKKMNDLISISQAEPASNSSLCDSPELHKKLKSIEKIPPEKKVNEWFKAVGDNIYINSPGSSILETDKNASEGESKKEPKSTMVRVDYNKCKPKENDMKPVDPYEFIPSQNNNNIYKKKRLKRSTRKKMPQLKALQSFCKESNKRNALLLNDSKDEVDGEEEAKDTSVQKVVTASQKFDQLLSETKSDEKKPHVLYTSSQSSSAQFLDVSFHSKLEEKLNKKKTPKVEIKTIDTEDVLFKNVEAVTSERSVRSKRRRSVSTPKSGKKKKLSTEMKSDEEPVFEELVEDYKIEAVKRPSTKLKELLAELMDDDVIYATRPANAPVRLPDLVLGIVDSNMKSPQAGCAVTQNTDLIGFCTQEETPYEKNFKQMVENMEKELNLSEYLVEESVNETKKDTQITETVILEENVKTDAPVQNICSPSNETSKLQLVEFLHLGKLTPLRKRAKSTVVKLVFPIGLSSLARRRAVENRSLPAVSVTKKPCQVSTGIQTSDESVSCLVQTSQVPLCSFNMQTTQEVKPSVEIQTTQNWTKTAEMQTSQRLVCQEIQTSQPMCESAQVQTTQPPFSLESNPKLPQTPIRKPSHHHRKILQSKNHKETPNSPADKDLIMDFGLEREFDETWRNTHDHIVEVKNEKNKKLIKKFPDSDSDDSDVQPQRRKGSFRIFSQESVQPLEQHETRQLIPLNVKKINKDDDVEVVDLDTPGSQNTAEQMLRVLKNIDLDLPKTKSGNAGKGEKSEESDSDFFVEQTPPRPTSRAFDEIKNLSKSRNFGQKQPENLENSDLIADSLPKGFSESFLLSNLPQRVPLSPEKNHREESQRKTSRVEPATDENDQNQLNAVEGKVKTPMKPDVKKLCVVASSVKNPDLIKKFVTKFKVEYSSKPTKNMTHLIVGLHENEDQEVLPLCTPKLLFAMANKKWVVNELWAESCLKLNTILPEESFETLDPVGGCGCRKARLSNEKLLKNCEIYLLGEFQMISKEEFADLISDCGGTLVPTPEKFSFLPTKLRMIIADRDCLKLNEKQLQDLYLKHSSVILSRDVIIMAIQSYKLVNFYPYLLHSASEENLLKLGYPLQLIKNEDEEEEGDISDGVL